MVASSATIALGFVSELVWPLFGLGVIYIFRRELRGLLGRLREAVGPGGVGAKFDSAQQQTAPNEVASEEFVEGLASATRELRITGAAQSEIDEPDDAAEPGATADSEAALTECRETVKGLQTQLAVRDLELDFERIWARIFGSQMDVLRVLRVAGEGAPRDTLEEIFKDAQARRGLLPSWTFDGWMAFLLALHANEASLVEVAQNGNYRLSQFGKAFLGYADALGYIVRPF